MSCASRWSAPQITAELKIKNQTHYDGNPIQSDEVHRLPLVGPAGSGGVRSQTKHPMTELIQSEEIHRLPLVGREMQNPVRKETLAAGRCAPASRLIIQ